MVTHPPPAQSSGSIRGKRHARDSVSLQRPDKEQPERVVPTYRPPFTFTGTIHEVTVDISGQDLTVDEDNHNAYHEAHAVCATAGDTRAGRSATLLEVSVSWFRRRPTGS